MEAKNNSQTEIPTPSSQTQLDQSTKLDQKENPIDLQANDKEVDPVSYHEHIQSEVKRAQSRATQKTLAKDLSEDQLEEERKIRREQLESIFKLMSDQEDKFGMKSMDDVQQQMKLYS